MNKKACAYCLNYKFRTGTENETFQLTTNSHECELCPKVESSFPPLQTVPPMGAQKHDQGKLEWHLLPEDAIEEILKVFQFGKNKYGDFNWLKEPAFNYTKLHNSLQRHRRKWRRGQNLDEESGLYEAAHMAANAIMILTYQLRKKGIDDRADGESNEY